MKNAKFGFTLVEIFIIVIIIGLLSAIAIPSYFKAKETSAKIFAENELKKQAEIIFRDLKEIAII